jgi:hypothetical protein
MPRTRIEFSPEESIDRALGNLCQFPTPLPDILSKEITRDFGLGCRNRDSFGSHRGQDDQPEDAYAQAHAEAEALHGVVIEACPQCLKRIYCCQYERILRTRSFSTASLLRT